MTYLKLLFCNKVIIAIVVVLVLGVAAIKPGILIWQNHYRHQVEQALSDLNGRISWNGENFDCDFNVCRSFSDCDLRRVLEVTGGRVSSLGLSSTLITDNGLSCLDGHDKLERLRLGYTKITDESIEYLANVSNLEALYLTNTKVRGTTLALLEKLQHLECLDLSYCSLDRLALSHVTKLNHLIALNLSGTACNINDLRQLASIHTLKRLILYDTAITKKEAAELERFFFTDSKMYVDVDVSVNVF